MIALQEQEIERRAWLSTDGRAELPFLSPLDEHEERRPTFAHDDDIFNALGSDDTTWEDTDAEEAPVEDDPTSEIVLDAGGPETGNVLAQYFGEVRHFGLLSFADEQTLGRRSNAGSGVSAGLCTPRRLPY